MPWVFSVAHMVLVLISLRIEPSPPFCVFVCFFVFLIPTAFYSVRTCYFSNPQPRPALSCSRCDGRRWSWSTGGPWKKFSRTSRRNLSPLLRSGRYRNDSQSQHIDQLFVYDRYVRVHFDAGRRRKRRLKSSRTPLANVDVFLFLPTGTFLALILVPVLSLISISNRTMQGTARGRGDSLLCDPGCE